MPTLQHPRVPGGEPLIREVEGLIGSSEIVGTSALTGVPVPGRVCAILVRMEPPALDLVHTMPLTITVLGRVGGDMELRVEEEVVLRDLDPLAVQRIAY
jgi:hypothetical protein